MGYILPRNTLTGPSARCGFPSRARSGPFSGSGSRLRKSPIAGWWAAQDPFAAAESGL